MKCPEKEQLMLFVDGELDFAESSEIKSHLEVCETCRHEAEEFRLDLKTEAMLRDKITAGFEKRSVSNKIMEAVKAEPRVAASKNTSSLWLNWFFKFMVPAIAIAIALFMFFLGSSSSQSPAKYTGKAYRVSAMANNNESLVDGKVYSSTEAFDVSAESFKKLDGSFIVNVVTPSQFYTIGVEGKANMGFDLTTMKPVFDDCNAKITMLHGESAKLQINGNSFDLSAKNIFNNINEVKTQSLEEETKIKPVEVKEKPEKKLEAVASPTEVITVTVEENVNTDSDSDKEKEISSKEINNSEESLTQEPSSGISIIDSTSDYGEEEASSPFSERKLGGI